MFVHFIRRAGLVYGTWYKIVNDRMGVRRARGAKWEFAPRLETGIMKHLFLEKPKVGILIPINWFDSCNDSFLPVWNPHCTRLSCTVIVSCSDELAVHSCPSFVCRGGFRKSRADFSAADLYCVTITWQKICKGSLCITVVGVLLHETVKRRHLGK